MDIATRSPSQLSLGFLCPHNPFDRQAFSGTSHFAAKALRLREDVSLRILGAHRPLGLMDRLLRRPSSKLGTEGCDISGLDAVIGLVATPHLNALLDRNPELPVIHVTDATPTFLTDAYGWALAPRTFEDERRLVLRARKVVYSSSEMAERARQDLKLPGLQAAVAPFGVNFATLPDTCPVKPDPARLELLFVGLDWARKGGDIAVAALTRLREQGIDAHLTIVGTCPETYRDRPDITYAGFLSKNRQRDAAKLSKLYRQAHLLLLPSRSDCTPMVLAEAMAHGTPAIATDTGGVASLLGGAGTGQLMRPFASPSEWAASIRTLMSDRAAYAMMSDACFDRGQAQLSWDAWAEAIVAQIRWALLPQDIPRLVSA